MRGGDTLGTGRCRVPGLPSRLDNVGVKQEVYDKAMPGTKHLHIPPRFSPLTSAASP